MMKKLLVTLCVLAYLTIGTILICIDGVITVAEICEVEPGTKIVSVYINTGSDGPYWGLGTAYTEGEVYEKFVAMFYNEKFHITNAGENLIWAGPAFAGNRIVYEFEEREPVYVLISSSDMTDSRWVAVMTQPDSEDRTDYILAYESWIDPSEIERLALAGHSGN